eukprot:tig00000194_g14762.t1
MVHERPGGRFVPGAWKKVEKEREERLAAEEKSLVGSINTKFSATSTKIELKFTEQTTGLQTKEEFAKKRAAASNMTLADIEAEERAEQERLEKIAAQKRKEEAQKRAAKLVQKSKLSFGGDEEDGGDESLEDEPGPPSKKQKQGSGGTPSPKKHGEGKRQDDSKPKGEIKPPGPRHSSHHADSSDRRKHPRS